MNELACALFQNYVTPNTLFDRFLQAGEEAIHHVSGEALHHALAYPGQ
jgi:hypothetical protein